MSASLRDVGKSSLPALQSYLQARLNLIRSRIENESDINELLRQQGKAKELSTIINEISKTLET